MSMRHTAAETAVDAASNPISWKRNLTVMWIAQSITVMGFGFTFPFVPLFIQQDLGVPDPAGAAFWTGISSGFMGIAMFTFGPIWGMVGDRYGRKKNVLRAMLGGVLSLVLTGLVTNVGQLVVLRVLNGVASGIFATVMALVASTTPRERVPFAMGSLQAAMLFGNTIGPLLGGLLAATVGFRGAYYVAGATLGISIFMVVFLARDNFEKPADGGFVFRHEALEGLFKLVRSRAVGPVLIVMFMIQMAPVLMFPVLPVLLDSLTSGGGAMSTGISFAILGITGAIASYIAGWLSARVSLTKMMVVACLGLGLSLAPFVFVDAVFVLYGLLAVAGAFQGVLIGSASGLMGVAIPPEQRGTGFGAVQSVSAGAFGFGPLIGGTIASVTGLRSVFAVQPVMLVIAAIFVALFLGRREGEQTLEGE